jgi:hypothetical protein
MNPRSIKMIEAPSLKAVWEGLADADRVSRIQRVGGAAKLAQYCAIDSAGNFAFYTKSKARPERLERLANLSVSVAQDKNGEWTRAITLMDTEYFEEFSILVESLVSAALEKPNETLALRAQCTAFEQWVAFYRRRLGFTLSAARGLFGELLILRLRQEQNQYSWNEALESWKGPFGNPQDFVFGPKLAEEVKTVNTSAKRVKINGVEQLNFHGDLSLTILTVRDSADSGSGETVAEVIELIRSDLTPAQKELLRERLDLVGFDPESDLATSRFFEAVKIDTYSVVGGFPRIDERGLHDAIDGVEYHLKISAIEGFRRSGG